MKSLHIVRYFSAGFLTCEDTFANPLVTANSS